MFEVADYSKYFKENTLSQAEENLLAAMQAMIPHGVTTTELAKLVNLSSHSVVNSTVGRLGHKISNFLNKRPEQRQDDSFRWWTIIANGDKRNGRMYWTLNRNVSAAMHNFEGTEIEHRHTSFSSEVYKEGAAAFSKVKHYERNPQARARCIEKWGPSCRICGFSFLDVYGEIGKGLIHVHHCRPLSEINEEYEIDPEEDLVPLCPNCHAVVHMREPPLTVEEVQELMKNNQQP